ncbi:MAG: hypothetical protein FWF76_03120 [Oscillospiraceae bacterium]|nr:hypothetical protein [Oscillospiraceae bacterium]
MNSFNWLDYIDFLNNYNQLIPTINSSLKSCCCSSFRSICSWGGSFAFGSYNFGSFLTGSYSFSSFMFWIGSFNFSSFEFGDFSSLSFTDLLNIDSCNDCDFDFVKVTKFWAAIKGEPLNLFGYGIDLI